MKPIHTCGVAVWMAVTLARGPAGAGADAGAGALPTRDENMARARTVLAELAAAIPAAERRLSEGLLADRQAGVVTLFAEATGLPPKSTAEFLLIGPASGHAYEALAVSLARPSEICHAIEFLGLPRGEPVFARTLSFWPRGERVRVLVRREAEQDDPEIAMESLIWDLRKDAPLCAGPGWIYSGSRWPADERCVADEDSPGSVIATYNEPTTVFDFPHLAPQSDVYERFVTHPEHRFAAGTLLRIRLIPESRPDGRPRVLPLTLDLSPDGTETPSDAPVRGILEGIAVALRGPEGPVNETDGTLAGALRTIRGRIRDGFDPYVTFRFDDGLSVAQARAISQAIQPFEAPDGLRAEGPPPDQLYYKAFTPSETWRKRAARSAQPWELHVEDGEATTLTLVEIREHWRDGQLHPDLEPVPTSGVTAETLPDLLDGAAVRLPVILVFAPPEATLSTFMPALRRVRETHHVVHVFTGHPQD